MLCKWMLWNTTSAINGFGARKKSVRCHSFTLFDAQFSLKLVNRVQMSMQTDAKPKRKSMQRKLHRTHVENAMCSRRAGECYKATFGATTTSEWMVLFQSVYQSAWASISYANIHKVSKFFHFFLWCLQCVHFDLKAIRLEKKFVYFSWATCFFCRSEMEWWKTTTLCCTMQFEMWRGIF